MCSHVHTATQAQSHADVVVQDTRSWHIGTIIMIQRYNNRLVQTSLTGPYNSESGAC
jgi:hypothetical protein